MHVSEWMVGLDAGWRMRGKIIRNLVRGESIPESLEFIVAVGHRSIVSWSEL